MRISKLLAGCIVFFGTLVGCKKEEPAVNNTLNDADKNFVRRAGISNYSEIETAKTAIAKTADSVVLSFAQQMLKAHTGALSDLIIMGTVVGFELKDSIDAEHAATKAHLDTLTGRSFDSAYIHSQHLEHQAAINFYNEELANGNQLNVKAYANTHLQSITLHHQRADSIATAFY